MPPKKVPDHGSRWWAKGDGPPRVADVVHDSRYKHKIRYHLLNDTRPYGHRCPPGSTSTPIEEWDAEWQAQPRTPLEWINTASVWRHIPHVGWLDRDRNLRVGLSDLVVVDRIQNGGVSLAKVDPDGTLERYSGGSLGMGRTTCHDFMWKFARVWCAFTGGPNPDDDLFPDVLYNLGYLKRHSASSVPTADETARAVETISKAEADIASAKRVLAARKKSLRPKEPRKRRPKKEPLKRLSAWERIMEDD